MRRRWVCSPSRACRAVAASISIAAGVCVAVAGPPAPSVTHGRDRIELSFELPEPAIEQVLEADGMAYATVRLPGYENPTPASGVPALPVIDAKVEAPRLEPLPAVLLTACAWEERPLAAPVRPSQPPVPKRAGARGGAAFARDGAAYRGSGWRSAWIEAERTWYRLKPIRAANVDYLRIELFLYAFDPARARLRYPRSVTVLLSWGEGEPSRPQSLRPRLGEISLAAVKVAGPEEMRSLVRRGFDVARRAGDEVTIYATADELEELRRSGARLRLLPNEAPARARSLSFKGEGGYRSAEGIAAALAEFERRRPDLCSVQSIGRSERGRDLWAVKISDGVEIDDPDEPDLRVTAGAHGDEAPGVEFCLSFIEHLLASYDADPRVKGLVDEVELWFLPLLNPDGHALGQRYNANGFDLNRSFPDRIEDPIDTVFDRPAEVAAAMRFFQGRSFALGCTFHTGAVVVNYPFDGNETGEPIYTATPDDALFRALSLRYASLNPRMRSSVDFSGGITNGAAWYVVYGGLQDWSYVWPGTNEVTVELWGETWPPASALPTIFEENREALLAYLEAARTAVAGYVRDAATGEVIRFARVAAAGIDHWIPVDESTGRFHRMLLPGTYTVAASAPGYETATADGVTIVDGSTTPLDIALARRLEPAGESVLVVAHESLGAGAGHLVEHFGEEGAAAELLTLRGAPAAAAIRDTVRSAYRARPFTYLVLAGDTDTLPSFSRGGYSSDLLYSLLDAGEGWDDVEGRDAIAGRIPFRTNEEFATYCGKLRDFTARRRDERFAWISQGNDELECGVASETHRWVAERLAAPSAYHAWFLCDGSGFDLFRAELAQRIDLVAYSGHGEPLSWARWNLQEGALAEIANEGHPPIVLSHACLTGRFEERRCLGEAWLATAGRAAAFVGATADTYWDEDDWLERAELAGLLAPRDPRSLGRALALGLEEVARRSDEETGKYYHEIYHVLGDPTLRVTSGLRIADVAWDEAGDGIAAPGEMGRLLITILNGTHGAAHALAALLEGESQEATLLSDRADLGDVERGATVVAAFDLAIAPAAAAGLAARFRLKLTSAEASVERTFTLAVHVVSAVTGRVVLEDTGSASPGVRVVADGPGRRETDTGEDGRFRLELIEGAYTISASLQGYFEERRALELPSGAGDLLFSLGWAGAEFEPPALELACPAGRGAASAATMRNPGTRPLRFRASLRGGVPCPPAWRYSVVEDRPISWADMEGAVEVAAGGVDDEAFGPLALPFAFPFFGEAYDAVYVSSNGFLSFFDRFIAPVNARLPSPAAPPLVVAGLWSDLAVSSQGGIFYGAGEERCVVEYRAVRHFGGAKVFSFQIILGKDGSIDFLYRDLPPGFDASIGVADRTRRQGVAADLASALDGRVAIAGEEAAGPAMGCDAYRAVFPGQPGGPAFEWVDMGGALAIGPPGSDDETWGPFTLPFAFDFFGEECRQVFVSANGFVSFARPSVGLPDNTFIPSPGAPGHLVAGLWDDLRIGDGGAVLLLLEDERCVVEYRGAIHLEGSGPLSFQIIVRDDGTIAFQYQVAAWDELSPTVGIQNGLGTEGLMVPPRDLAGGAVMLTSAPPWLEIEPLAGEIAAGSALPIAVTAMPPRGAKETLASTLIARTTGSRSAVVELPISVHPTEAGWYFTRGDANQDGSLNVSDAVTCLRHLFRGSRPRCSAALDANGDGQIQIADPIYLLMYLFRQGSPPPPPFPACGFGADPQGAFSCDEERCAP